MTIGAGDTQEAVDERRRVWLAEKPMRKWKDDIAKTDNGMPRYLEDLITDNPSLTIHEKMKTRYDEKIALRGEHP